MKMENITISSIQSDSKVKKGNPCDISVEKSLKPLLVSMKIAAMYFEPTPAKGFEAEQTERKPSWIKLWLTCRVYCYAILLISWLNVVRFVVGLFPADDGLPLRVCFFTWYLQSAVNSTIMLVSCQRLKHLRSFYKHWDSLFNNFTTQQMGCGYRCPLKYLKVVTAAGWGLIVINITTISIFLFGDTPMSEYYIINIVRPFPVHPWIVIVQTIIHSLASGGWIFPVIFVSAIARIIKGQFLQFRICLSTQIHAADGSIPDHLPKLRCRYTQLCKAVEIINGTFKWILGLSFILQIFLACFISYLLITKPADIFATATNVFWLSSCVIIILVLAISSASVNDSAHSLLDDIFSVGTKNATTEQHVQLNLFLTKLTGTSIGFTAIDFFVITKDFLLTLGGLYVTYFFLLLQFKMT